VSSPPQPGSSPPSPPPPASSPFDTPPAISSGAPEAGAPPPRGPQRRSIFSGLLLILLGIVFLLFRFYPNIGLGRIIWHFWPVVIIVWGIAKLVDHLAARRTGERTSVLTGGEAALLIVVIFCLAGLGLADSVRKRSDFEFNFHPFQQRYSESEALPAKKIPPGTHISIETRRGNISVHTTDGDELRVTVNKSASDSNESAADERMARAKTIIEQTAHGFSVHPTYEQGWEGPIEADLDVELPKQANVTAETDRGDVTVAGIGGTVDASTHSGDMEIHDIGSDVTATLQKGNLQISNIAGNLRVNGRGSEIDVSDVAGDASFDGEFFGPVRVRNIANTTRYLSQRSDLTLVHLTGRMELASGLQISDVGGTAKLATHNKDIEIENVAGPLDIADSHGDIRVRYSHPPSADINIADDSGQIDLTLPAKSSFEISAVSRSGQVDSEFQDPSLQLVNDENTGKLTGKFASHGPKISIVTSYGTISLHKST
jgi:hypothetical protein